MQRYNVPDISCAHCVQTIEQAVTALDPTARVVCDLATKEVAIESPVPPARIEEALAAAGYDSMRITG